MKNSIIIYIIVLVFLTACNRKTDVAKYVQHKMGKTVIIDKTHYEPIDNSLLDSLFENSSLMIFTTPHEKACASCFFSRLQEVHSLIDSCNTDKVNCVVFVPEHYDEYLDLKIALDADHIFFINDYNDSYTKDNNLIKYTADYRTFLVDNKGKILLVGSPLFNVKVKELYEKEIKELLKMN